MHFARFVEGMNKLQFYEDKGFIDQKNKVIRN